MGGITPTALQAYMPIYRNKGGDYLFYSAPYVRWYVGPNDTSLGAQQLKSGKQHTTCPEETSGWVALLDLSWTPNCPILINRHNPLPARQGMYRYLRFEAWATHT